MKLMSLFLAAVMSGAARVSSAQQATTFIMTMGADTLGIERVTRTPGHLDGDFVSPARGVRVRYAATIAADGTMPQIETWAYRSAGDTSGTHASMQLQGDSMIIELQARTLRLASKPGAIAYFNPSVGLLEQAIIRAQSLGAGPTVEVPLFASEGAMTVPLSVTKIGSDSLHLSLNGIAITSRSAWTDASPGCWCRRRMYACLKLTGTLTLPKAIPAGGVPAVVTITGSGTEERDESLPGVNGY